MGKDKDLVAPDGLHPSAKEHKIWESLIYPAAFELLK
jgi:lysophospholipase L1-like esterase